MTQRKTPAPKTTVPEGLLALDEDEDPTFFEVREPLFSLAGKVYDARVNFAVSEVTAYSRISRTEGIDAGIEYLLTLALGDEGYEAYSGYKYLRREPANKIVKQVLDRFLGEEIDPK
jgi:hypothetical protein